MPEVHLVVGCALILLNGIAFVVGGVAWYRDRASIPFWYLLRAAQHFAGGGISGAIDRHLSTRGDRPLIDGAIDDGSTRSGRHHRIAPAHIIEHLAQLFRPLLLRTDDKEVKDRKDRDDVTCRYEAVMALVRPKATATFFETCTGEWI